MPNPDWPGANYGVIYADPPWRCDFCAVDSAAVEKHHATMAVVDICSLNPPSARNSALFLWVPPPKLVDGMATLSAWGFEYKTHCVWRKDWPMFGYWFRAQHELLLVGTRGKFSPPPSGLLVASVVDGPRNGHSGKPGKFRELISAWYPLHRKLEMFARPDPAILLDGSNAYDGWDVWGMEAEKTGQPCA